MQGAVDVRFDVNIFEEGCEGEIRGIHCDINAQPSIRATSRVAIKVTDRNVLKDDMSPAKI